MTAPQVLFGDIFPSIG